MSFSDDAAGRESIPCSRTGESDDEGEQLSILISLGFSPSMSRLGLEAAERRGGTVAAAVEWMINRQRLEREADEAEDEDEDERGSFADELPSRSSRRSGSSEEPPFGGSCVNGESDRRSAGDRSLLARGGEGAKALDELACIGERSGPYGGSRAGSVSTPQGQAGSMERSGSPSSKYSSSDGGGTSKSSKVAAARVEEAAAHEPMALESSVAKEDQRVQSPKKISSRGEGEKATAVVSKRRYDANSHTASSVGRTRDGRIKDDGFDEMTEPRREDCRNAGWCDPKSSAAPVSAKGGDYGKDARARPETVAATDPHSTAGGAGRVEGATRPFASRSAFSGFDAEFGTRGAYRVSGPTGDVNGGDDDNGEGTISASLSMGVDYTPGVSTPLPAVAVPDAGRRALDHHRRDDDDRMLQRMIQNAPLVRGQALPKSADDPNQNDGDGCAGRRKRTLAAVLVSCLIVCVVAVPLALLLPEKETPAPPSPDADKGEVMIETLPTLPQSTVNATNMTATSTTTTTTSAAVNVSERFRAIERVLFPNNDTASWSNSSSAFRDPSPPRFRAIQWLADEDNATIPLQDIERLKQRYALAAIYFSSSGSDGWSLGLKFLSGQHECDWWDQVCDPSVEGSCHFFFGALRGVRCNSRDRVMDLRLGALGLQGTLPAYEISLLSDLRILSLGANNMTGPLNEEAFRNLGKLSILDLHNNFFTGTLPALNKLYYLQALYLWSNLLTGTVGDTFPPYIAEMPMYDNLLTGSLPESLGKLEYASFVSFGSNMLLGTLPSAIRDMWSLEIFEAMGNQLTGTIPTFLGDIPNIIALGLGHNKFNGTIPPQIFRPPTLLGVSVEGNDLTGTIPLIESPSFLGLSAHSNRLEGTVPASLGNCSNLMFLDLANNNIEGMLPESFQNLENLYWLSLMENNMSGDLNAFCGIATIPPLADCKAPDEEVTCDCCWCCRDGEECGMYIDVVTMIWKCMYGDRSDCPIWGFM
eukprot:CAMPEP_0113567934 /NCGR_PEP_ID=MMETSP0015_2-20120614/23555_1 /TAXON_ID=2838 /ORGANISM="Odontella" /LENGTH=985 /DNA_ID=CAMNT_0000470391 /DNA_START=155 /DNA_END=3112 /DNA_ORIENTATION=+ /assembly_acc=CAM_ASM_000160